MNTNRDPRDKYPRPPFPQQQQEDQPGMTREMTPSPDHGERSYRGANRLAGLRTLVTGGDSGIGRAVAIAFAREGADLAIAYLPTEQSDAEETARFVKQEGRRCILLPGDLRSEAACTAAIDETVGALGRVS